VARVGEARLVVSGAVLLMSGFAGLRALDSVPVLLLALAVIALGIGITTPSLSSLVSRRSLAGEQGEILGAYQSMGSLGRVVGPFGSENMYFRIGPDGPHWAAAALEAAALSLSATGLLRENGGGLRAKGPAPSR